MAAGETPALGAQASAKKWVSASAEVEYARRLTRSCHARALSGWRHQRRQDLIAPAMIVASRGRPIMPPKQRAVSLEEGPRLTPALNLHRRAGTWRARFGLRQ